MRPRSPTLILASILALSAALLVAAATSAHAAPVALSKQFETDKRLGAGLMLGVPAGVSAKYMFTSTVAIDVGVGGYLLYRDRDGFAAHGDLLWHPFVAVEGESFLAPLYLGLGIRFLAHDSINHVGVRVPVGLAFVFDESPIDVFVESAFVYDFSVSEDDESAFDANGVIGIRYYFL